MQFPTEMVEYSRHTLANGLTVICSCDRGTPFVSINVLYRVGSRNESPDRTGFAHLFEHLMFGGSAHAADFDREVQMAGGDNNAYTTHDYTNYYITLPAANVETALWLEADRMQALSFSPHALDVQRHVVMEEYKQSYLNVPYGDVTLNLRPLAYKVHPYRWSTIGKSLDHIENASLGEVKAFFARFYAPDNAIVCICGDIAEEKAFALVEKWFGDIAPSKQPKPSIPEEPEQNEERRLVLEKEAVPADMLWKAYHMGGRLTDNFYCCDVISDILSNGNSSRLYQKLVKESGLFAEIDATVGGETDPGLFVINGKPSDGVTLERAENAINEVIERFVEERVSVRELEKVIHKAETRISCSEVSYQSKAENLAVFEFLGDAELMNREANRYERVSPAQIQETARGLFRPENCSTLVYKKK